jgi:hypothetical protein
MRRRCTVAAPAAAPRVPAPERVSVSSRGVQADGASYDQRASAAGRYVASDSNATNLVPGDNGVGDILPWVRPAGR